ncbi:DUF1328 family protein [Palleronia caenipelagi]|uniref:UPF0391 membrane protein FEV53_14030 n=1 Tax=Palleronia caenipelagi TaxID=2489174 RepID=A0A547PR51_9RHOB|nr:DUF1328 family protein [Palleronia caenipelagi]TRD16620.1 DUF1328 domain-containing protein [Palleronia caenipelagi]
MLSLFITLLVVAAIAALLGLGRVSGVALSAARLIIFIALILFLLSLLGVVVL